MVHRAYCPPISGTVHAVAPSAAAASTPSAVRVRMAAAAAEGPAVNDEVETAPAKIMDTAADAGVPWDQTRVCLIRKLQDNKSDIHLYLLGQTSTRTMSKNILEKFAPHHNQENRVQSVMRLLREFKNKKGPHFSTTKANNNCKPAWKTRGKSSEAASLLYKLLLEADKTKIDKMSPEQVHKFHKVFQAYEVNDFKNYFKKTAELVKKHRYACS